jgi:hypothetical protein
MVKVETVRATLGRYKMYLTFKINVKWFVNISGKWIAQLAPLSKAELGCDACVVGEHTDHSGSSAYAFCRGHLVHRQGAGLCISNRKKNGSLWRHASRNVLATLPFRNVMGSQATKIIPCTPVFITGGLPSAHQRFHKKSHNNERLAVPHSRESRGSSAPEVESQTSNLPSTLLKRPPLPTTW